MTVFYVAFGWSLKAQDKEDFLHLPEGRHHRHHQEQQEDLTEVEGFVQDLVDEAGDEEYFESGVDKEPRQDIPLVPATDTHSSQRVADQGGREESNETVSMHKLLIRQELEVPVGATVLESSQVDGR